MERPTKRGPVGFRVIGAFKLLGALLLFGAGIGVFRLLGRDVGEALEDLAATCRIDPNNHYIHGAISWASGIDRSRLKIIGVGTFFYATLYAAEGIGLVLGTTWGGYLTAIATGSLIPLEIWEVLEKPDGKRVAVLVINVAILGYVVWKLIQERRAASAGTVSS